MTVFEYNMAGKLPQGLEVHELERGHLERKWGREGAALVLLHPGSSWKDILENWGTALDSGQISVLFAAGGGYSRRQFEPIEEQYNGRVHFLKWSLGTGRRSPWMDGVISSFVEHARQHPGDPPDWSLLYAVPRPENLVTAYIFRRLGEEVPEEVSAQARAEFDELGRVRPELVTDLTFSCDCEQLARILEVLG